MEWITFILARWLALKIFANSPYDNLMRGMKVVGYSDAMRRKALGYSVRFFSGLC